MMTENKRYVRILDYSEKEVRIFDEHNQKNIFNIFFEGLDSAICLKGALEDTVDLLNYFYEEKKNLKEENEQLKKQLKCSREEADDYCEELMGKDEFVRLYKRQRDDALKENKQLKQQIEELEFKLRTIEAYDRTIKEEHSYTVDGFKKKLEQW